MATDDNTASFDSGGGDVADDDGSSSVTEPGAGLDPSDGGGSRGTDDAPTRTDTGLDPGDDTDYSGGGTGSLNPDSDDAPSDADPPSVTEPGAGLDPSDGGGSRGTDDPPTRVDSGLDPTDGEESPISDDSPTRVDSGLDPGDDPARQRDRVAAARGESRTDSQQSRQPEGDQTYADSGLEEQYGNLGSGDTESPTGEATQRLQSRIDREVPGVRAVDTDQYDITRDGDSLSVELSPQARRRFRQQRVRDALAAEDVPERDIPTQAEIDAADEPEDLPGMVAAPGGGARVAPGVREAQQTARIQESIQQARVRFASERPGVEPEEVTVDVENGQLVASAPEPEGNPAIRGTEANRVVRQQIAAENEGLRADEVDVVNTDDGLAYQRDGALIGADDDLDFGGSDVQRETPTRAPRSVEEALARGGAVRTSGSSEPVVATDPTRYTWSNQQPLIEPEQDYSAVEVLTGQAAASDPQFQKAAINDALGAVGLADDVGFREPTSEQANALPNGDPDLRYLRGAGPRRQYQVEAETAGEAVMNVATDRQAQAAALAGIAAPEPATTLGGAAVLATGGVIAASQQNRDGPTAVFDEVDVPDGTDQGELEVPEGDEPNELRVPEESSRGEIDAPRDGKTFGSEIEPVEDTSPAEIPVSSGSTQGQDVDASEGDETVVPGDYPLAGRDVPADPSQEYVSGERIDPPVASASPIGVAQPEVEGGDEEATDDGLGVPTDDPFRRSDNRLYDPQREFGEQEDVANIPDEATPDGIEDVGSGIAGQGRAMESARGETVADNWEQYLQEREAERRREIARQQQALIQDENPTGRAEVRELIEEASDGRGLQRTRAVEDSFLGVDGPLDGLAGGGRARERADVGSRGDARDRIDQTPRNQPRYGEGLRGETRQETPTDLTEEAQQQQDTTPELLEEFSMGNPTSPGTVPELIYDYPTPPGRVPKKTPTPPPNQIPKPDAGDDEPLFEPLWNTEFDDRIFDTGVVQTFEEFENTNDSFEI